MADQDNRQGPQRPRTKQDDQRFTQPIGWSGIDPNSQREMNPVRTFETPLIFFPQEILVPINSNLSIPLPPRCAQIAFVSVVPGVWASFNNGGTRTVLNSSSINGQFSTLDILTDGTGTCLIQLACY